MLCNNCGSSIDEGALACLVCGQEVSRTRRGSQHILFSRSKAKMLASLKIVEAIVADAKYTPPGTLSPFTIALCIVIAVIIILASLSLRPASNGNAASGTASPLVSIRAISPSSGADKGDVSVTIIGVGFHRATGVSFGPTAASSFVINSDTEITAVSPAGSGTVDVTVTTSTGTSSINSNDQFTYTAPTTGSPSPTATPLPVNVAAISPASGSNSGGTIVTIIGISFKGASGVSFGSVTASRFNVNSDTEITVVSPAGSGTVDVTVTTANGTSTRNSNDQFTYTSPPPPTITPLSVTAVSPSSGPSAGGTTVTITGISFTDATSVSFGSIAGSNLAVVNDTQITVVSPAGSGTVDVTVTTPSGTSAVNSNDQFTYIPPPIVTSINPPSGSSSGGTTVTITGSGFTGATNVSFGSTAGSNLTVVNDTQITAVSPAGSGTVDVTVTTTGGTSAINLDDQFTYVLPPPAVTNISPHSGPIAGGTTVTITGSGFTGATSVSFGSVVGSNLAVVNDTQITVTSPAGSGTVNVTVTTPYGTSATNGDDQFVYIPPPPVVSNVNPNLTGATKTTVVITGVGFTNAINVFFGSQPADSFTIISDTQITAVTTFQGTTTNTVDVTVTNLGGTSAISSNDQFTYEVVS